ncbi:ATP-binding response regulator [Massilia glaciei]|nr:ATP-binding protein [Massilia glaciei]
MASVQERWHGARLDTSSALVRFTLALVLFALSLGIRFALIGVLPPTGFPFLTFFPAVMLAAFVAGLWPGVLVATLSILAAWRFFIAPSADGGLASGDVIALVFFSGVLLVDCVIIHLMTTALGRARSTSEQLLHSEAQFRALAGKLQQADLRKDEFLAMLAHELRNPLAPIAAAAELLGMGAMDEQKVQRTSLIIGRQVRHLTGLIDDLLDVSRVTRGLVRLERQPLDAKRVVAEAVEQIQPLLDRRRQRLSLHIEPESAFVLGDQKRLVQVVANLLNNAAKFTPEGGAIELALGLEDGQVRLALTDNGIGMAPDFVEQAFELFAQGERASDRSQGGLGIGLALVRSLVELHGGRARAGSDGLGKGSRFEVWLPRLAGDAGAAGGAGAPSQLAPADAGLRVLIVDDNVDAADMLGMFVESLGHRVWIDTSADAARVTAMERHPQVCLLDIGLPGMDGNELARRLRAHPGTAGAVLVAITGYGQEQDRISSMQAGFDHHFVKPVDTARLKDLLGAIASANAGANAGLEQVGK